MIIQIDSREHAKAIKWIKEYFATHGIEYIISKLYVGDYMNYDNPRLIIDRKQNLTELCSNVTTDHDRFRRELQRAQELGIQIIVLCEHGEGIETLEDVIFWTNPRKVAKYYDKKTKKWTTRTTKATSGETLFKVLKTIEQKYGCRFLFCNKRETPKKIIELLEAKNGT